MKCFYHGDSDGKCAGFWVALSAGLTDYEKYETEFVEIDYRKKFPLETIQTNEQIYIVDYSIEPNEMRQLLQITNDVTWIDHHKTAIEKYQDFEHDIRGVRYDGIAGCMLTYCYLHHMTQRGLGEIKPFELSMTFDAPMFTKYIADWDVWTFKYEDDTRYFKMGSDALDLSPNSEEWMNWLGYENETKTINNGKVITQFRDEWAKNYVQNLGFETNFEGNKCYAVNLGYCNSEYFKSLPEGKYNVLMPFSFDGSIYTVSMYSKTVDVSEIAKKYGGGGHAGASGFQCKALPFSKSI